MVINSAINNLNLIVQVVHKGRIYIYSDAVDAIMKCFNNKLIIGKLLILGQVTKLQLKI